MKYTMQVIGVISVMLAVLIGFITLINNSVQADCLAQFGEGWKAKTGPYSHSICINSNGEVKYPQ